MRLYKDVCQHSKTMTVNVKLIAMTQSRLTYFPPSAILAIWVELVGYGVNTWQEKYNYLMIERKYTNKE